MPKYPRDCEIWEDVDTSTTFLVPDDCKGAILKAKKTRNIQMVAEFTAQDKNHMMETFYLLTGRGEYSPPKTESRSFGNSNGSKSYSSGASYDYSSGKVYKKPSALVVLRNALNEYGAEKYRRVRVNMSLHDASS